MAQMTHLALFGPVFVAVGHPKLVLESPVRSGFSALNGFNRNRNRLN
jgi:hypothetical protein